ncbi:MAG: hemolysin family protein [Arthrobacter sp.]|uniref:hemolysin family protein n=1 Tax=unclassified Arthrobacter TaxID=235627 RepID=UPI00264A9204|nr:hemolysin family protein [Micrococcaceae bacterium]MDN5812233.1 hemolysin family protein [Micrococcaceae bacterium]MDN5879211.1 hemolysin family protein [Micrococcaceae bacterium]MDN5887027.1 hemolysin family protein [Micrococcaceae bacterium]MDN5904928.1 hemolysin family protein [Micrococcaceae bacterium]
MIPALLLALALVFVCCAAILTASEAAFLALPRQEAEDMLAERPRRQLRLILSDPAAHTHAVRFWRIWFETAGAVAIALLYHDLLDNIWWAGLLATVTMAAVGFVLVGVSPRRYGRVRSRSVVVLSAPMVRVLRLVLGPIPGWLVSLGSSVAKGAPATEEAFFTEEQFRDMVDRAHEADIIEDVEADLIHSVFELGDTRVRAVMVPRTDMVTVDHGSSLGEAMSLFLRSGCSRIPVIRDNPDQIVGIIYLKDVAARLHARPDDHHLVEQACRDVRYVPESKSVAELLQELQRESTHVAIVIDEYGGTAGLVTLEDLIEEIVGEIDDEYDDSTNESEELEDGVFRVSARMSIDDFAELFQRRITDDEVDTVGGLLAKTLGRVPIVGSEVTVDGIRIHAERLAGRRNRIGFVLAWVDEYPEAADNDEGSLGRLAADDVPRENKE